MANANQLEAFRPVWILIGNGLKFSGFSLASINRKGRLLAGFPMWRLGNSRVTMGNLKMFCLAESQFSSVALHQKGQEVPSAGASFFRVVTFFRGGGDALNLGPPVLVGSPNYVLLYW